MSSASPDRGGPLNRLLLLEEHASAVEELRSAAPDSSRHERLGFLRACALERPPGAPPSDIVEAASQRLRVTAAWRGEVGVDGAMSDPERLSEEIFHRRLLLYDFPGCDRHGRPVLIERVGAWDVPAVADAATEDPDRFVLLHCMAVETLVRMERPCGCIDPRGQVVVMDCLGLGTEHLNPSLVNAMRAISKVDSDHYPDTLAELWVVNAPYVFSAVASLCRPFLSSETLQKFHVSSGVPPELADLVGPEVLPVELGGERKNCFPYDVDAPLSEHPKSSSASRF